MVRGEQKQSLDASKQGLGKAKQVLGKAKQGLGAARQALGPAARLGCSKTEPGGSKAGLGRGRVGTRATRRGKACLGQQSKAFARQSNAFGQQSFTKGICKSMFGLHRRERSAFPPEICKVRCSHSKAGPRRSKASNFAEKGFKNTSRRSGRKCVWIAQARADRVSSEIR